MPLPLLVIALEYENKAALAEWDKINEWLVGITSPEIALTFLMRTYEEVAKCNHDILFPHLKSEPIKCIIAKTQLIDIIAVQIITLIKNAFLTQETPQVAAKTPEKVAKENKSNEWPEENFESQLLSDIDRWKLVLRKMINDKKILENIADRIEKKPSGFVKATLADYDSLSDMTSAQERTDLPTYRLPYITIEILKARGYDNTALLTQWKIILSELIKIDNRQQAIAYLNDKFKEIVLASERELFPKHFKKDAHTISLATINKLQLLKIIQHQKDVFVDFVDPQMQKLMANHIEALEDLEQRTLVVLGSKNQGQIEDLRMEISNAFRDFLADKLISAKEALESKQKPTEPKEVPENKQNPSHSSATHAVLFKEKVDQELLQEATVDKNTRPTKVRHNSRS